MAHCPDCGARLEKVGDTVKDERYESFGAKCLECESLWVITYDNFTAKLQVEEHGWGKR